MVKSRIGQKQKIIQHLGQLPLEIMGQESAVSIATWYRVGSSGFEFRWEQDFLHPFRPALEPTQPPVSGYQVSFPAAGAWH